MPDRQELAHQNYRNFSTRLKRTWAAVNEKTAFFTNFGETTNIAPIDANALAVLNQAAGLFLGNLGGANTAFATGQNGAVATDYAPGGSNPINTFGDFAANLNAIVAFPGINSPVPEPSSMVLLATGSVLAGLFAARRRKNAKKA